MFTPYDRVLAPASNQGASFAACAVKPRSSSSTRTPVERCRMLTGDSAEPST